MLTKARMGHKDFMKSELIFPHIELGNLVFGISRGEWPIPRVPSYEMPVWNLIDQLNDNHDKGSTHLYNTEFSNEVFYMRNYYWGDCTCGIEYDEEGDEIGEHKENCLLIMPNFHHFKSGLKVMWYKYPLRDSYANREVSTEEWTNIMNECIQSYNPLEWLDEL